MISLPKKVVSFLLIITVMMSCIFAGETVTVSANKTAGNKNAANNKNVFFMKIAPYADILMLTKKEPPAQGRAE